MRKVAPVSKTLKICEISHLCVDLAAARDSGLAALKKLRRKIRDFLAARLAGHLSNRSGQTLGRCRRCGMKTARGTF